MSRTIKTTHTQPLTDPVWWVHFAMQSRRLYPMLTMDVCIVYHFRRMNFSGHRHTIEIPNSIHQVNANVTRKKKGIHKMETFIRNNCTLTPPPPNVISCFHKSRSNSVNRSSNSNCPLQMGPVGAFGPFTTVGVYWHVRRCESMPPITQIKTITRHQLKVTFSMFACYIALVNR